MKVFTNFILAVSLAFVGAENSSYAQVPPEALAAALAKKQDSLPVTADVLPGIRASLAGVLSEAEDSPLVSQLMESGLNPDKVIKPLDDTEIPVIQHLRAKDAKDTFSFPTLEQVTKAQEERSKKDEEKFAALQADPQFVKLNEEAQKAVQDMQKEPVAAPELPSCPEDATQSYRISDMRPEKPTKNEKLRDDLVVIKGPIPLDPDLAFGQNTDVIRYTTKPGDALSLALAAQGLSCLPYRIRTTEEHVIHDLGTNALKNYDNDPRGELYEGIKAKLNEYR